MTGSLPCRFVLSLPLGYTRATEVANNGAQMIQDGKVVVMDVDGTLAAEKREGQSYLDVAPIEAVKRRLVELKGQGWHVVLFTSRNMRSYGGNVGEIMAKTAPVLIEWLNRHGIPYDELHFGKPWCGFEGFYVDDKAIRPREFLTLSLEEIRALLERDRGDAR